MAVGKVKKAKAGASAGGKKTGGKKKVVDPFTRKEWYDIKAPSVFTNRNVGKTVVNKTVGTTLASDSLKGRVVEASLGDLNKNESQAWCKIKLRVDDVNGRNCLTNFHGMEMTSDKHRSLIRKWQTLIEANVDVRTTDGYLLRLFAIGFTARRPNQIKKTTYAQTSKVKAIRKKMFEIMIREASTCDLQAFVAKLIPESIPEQIIKETQMIFPLSLVHIRKVKVLKTPKFDPYKLMEIHAEGNEDKGQKVETPAPAAAAETTTTA
eukprot:Phypoly_transcript_15798.p1 GENE.Phypoly_transcript_15798~~Phypoly_transcript_15798.p1  ORF type:complete len:265 (+),score=55.53 Phypoly_transcript_15798:47-841(+)